VSKKRMNDALLSKSSTRSMFAETNDSGLLIVFEGADGSGKTTQRKLFKSWLASLCEEVVVTKWNSSTAFKPLIKARKAARLLDPISYATLHAADFWHRYEHTIQPSLAAGKIVLADRYVFTGLARDAARGMSREWCHELYAGARKPDLVFYFKAAVDTCAARITASREMKYYESGQDVTGIEDPCESYLHFTPKVIAEYQRLHERFGFVIVDAERPIYEQHAVLREAYFRRKHWLTVAGPSFEPQLNPLPS
jgi:dTMP kinase